LFSRNIYTSSGDKLKIVVLLSRVERDKTLGEIISSQLLRRRSFVQVIMMVHNTNSYQ
jgi:hypothetical protein